jgi:hypothetical protein
MDIFRMKPPRKRDDDLTYSRKNPVGVQGFVGWNGKYLMGEPVEVSVGWVDRICHNHGCEN